MYIDWNTISNITAVSIPSSVHKHYVPSWASNLITTTFFPFIEYFYMSQLRCVRSPLFSSKVGKFEKTKEISVIFYTSFSYRTLAHIWEKKHIVRLIKLDWEHWLKCRNYYNLLKLTYLKDWQPDNWHQFNQRSKLQRKKKLFTNHTIFLFTF